MLRSTDRSRLRAYFVFGLCLLCASMAEAQTDEAFFETKIRPVLISTCLRCHGDLKTSAGLRLDSREALTQGGDSVAAVVPGEPEESLLIQAIRRGDGVSAMPPDKDKALRPDQIEDFVAWVKAGAVWPAQASSFQAEKHWAFEPVRSPTVPEVRTLGWADTRVDRFVQARQEADGVEAAPQTDRLTLIRRATFDLTGLPPTVDELDSFLEDSSPVAFEKVLDRLLASPAYGERWGRHWLDVVRYADTAGETADYPVPDAWRYRNYVVDAFNADLPYDQFLQEQVAGDILAYTEPAERFAARATATGYLALSRRFGFDSENYHHLMIQDTIDTVGQSFLGLSLGCARCHDHKFDPISTQEYYALYGIFDSSIYAFPGSEQKPRIRSRLPIVSRQDAQRRWREHQDKLAAVRTQLQAAGQPVPQAQLASLLEMDGNFELQAPAAGGSNGVLVPPWRYQGKIAVTTSAQSPFQNVYSGGRVGVSLPAGHDHSEMEQAVHGLEDHIPVFLNLDFRVTSPPQGQDGRYGVSLGPLQSKPVVIVWISRDSLTLQTGETLLSEPAPVSPGQWQNLQLTLDMESRTLKGLLGTPDCTVELPPVALSGGVERPWQVLKVQSHGDVPALELDNLAVRDTSFAPVSLAPAVSASGMPDIAALARELQSLAGIDGDLELQTEGAPPSTPWNPGPNSLVVISANSQSPFRNCYGPGKLGIHLPNRQEYDGFGLSLPPQEPDPDGRLHISFDFRCASQNAGDNGSWRYYLGQGAGPNPAVELFFNGTSFFQRAGENVAAVAPLEIGRWYQVQLVLDLRQKTYRGILASTDHQVPFEGRLAAQWNGMIDYTFIDSYGHIPGVRPALDVDQIMIRSTPLPMPNAPAPDVNGQAPNRERALAIRDQIQALKRQSEQLSREYSDLLVNGPFPMAYGVTEGTPHNVRIQKRGEPDQPGEEVARGFLRVLGGTTLPVETPGSGRLELAQWLADSSNPLTARVMANRIWLYHFGRGLVKTPNDFGLRGQPPTHPELLDHLATEFMHKGWSIKAIHREIMRSATYQQSSQTDQTRSNGVELGAVEKLYAAFPERRLSAEEIRDAILAVSGELDRSVTREHPFPSPLTWGFSQHGPFLAVYGHNKRSLYLMTQRLKRHPFLALFDGADPNASTPQRQTTTVPTQALFFLNDPMIHATSGKWATRLFSLGSHEQARLDLAWRQGLGRPPSAAELAEAVEFLNAYRLELAAEPVKESAEIRALAAYLRSLLASNEFEYVY